MEKVTFSDYDHADFLRTEEDIEAALQVAFEDDPGDGSLIAETIGLIARAKGMSNISKETGMARESLYRALSGEGNPAFKTICKALRAIGFNFSFTPMHRA